MTFSLIKLILRIPLSDKDQTNLVNAVINRLGIPLRSILAIDGNRRILVNGRPLSIEQSQQIQEGSYALLKNPARKLIRDQVRFQAVDKGYLQSNDPKVQLFYKAALLFAQEEDELVRTLAGNPDII